MLPFVWGLEHIGGDASEADPRAFLSDSLKTPRAQR